MALWAEPVECPVLGAVLVLWARWVACPALEVLLRDCPVQGWVVLVADGCHVPRARPCGQEAIMPRAAKWELKVLWTSRRP